MEKNICTSFDKKLTPLLVSYELIKMVRRYRHKKENGSLTHTEQGSLKIIKLPQDTISQLRLTKITKFDNVLMRKKQYLWRIKQYLSNLYLSTPFDPTILLLGIDPTYSLNLSQ